MKLPALTLALALAVSAAAGPVCAFDSIDLSGLARCHAKCNSAWLRCCVRAEEGTWGEKNEDQVKITAESKLWLLWECGYISGKCMSECWISVRAM